MRAAMTGERDAQGWRDALPELARHFHLPLLGLLIAADIALIAAHIVTGVLLPRIPPWLNIALDHSLPEIFCYLELLAASGILLLAYRRTGLSLCLGLALILLLMMLDDSLQLHELIGAFLAEMFHIPAFAGVKSKDTGELLAWALLGLVVGLTGLVALLRTPFASWSHFYVMVALVGLLGFFAVGIDFLHDPICVATTGFAYCTQIFDLIEDGGEMIVQSFILAHVARNFFEP